MKELVDLSAEISIRRQKRCSKVVLVNLLLVSYNRRNKAMMLKNVFNLISILLVAL